MEAQVGRVTSGSPAPYLEEEHWHGLRSGRASGEGQQIQIDVRGRLVEHRLLRHRFINVQKA